MKNKQAVTFLEDSNTSYPYGRIVYGYRSDRDLTYWYDRKASYLENKNE